MSSATESDVITGALKLLGKVDCECFTSWQDFIAQIPKMFGVVVPASITNVVISDQQPDDDQREYLWIKRSTSGSVVGLFVYATGDWRQLFPTPKGIIRMFGDHRNIPAGYQLIDASNPNFTAAEVTHIQSSWMLSSDSSYYTIFDVTYVGF